MERNPEYTDYEEVKQLILKAGSVRKAEDLLKNKSDLDI
jgi:N-acetylmuramic acid 6-phosphate etherase